MPKICNSSDLRISVVGSREPNTIPYGNKFRRLKSVVEARSTLLRLIERLTENQGA